MKITVEYFGHSCFRLSDPVHSVILDPYDKGSVPGVEMPEGLCADRVFTSHGHHDHNARHLVTETNGMEDVFDARFITVPHDDEDGRKRGLSDITVLQIGKVKAVHFGDIGRIPAKDEYEKLKGADLVMIPVGGHFTIDAMQAKEIVDTLQPALTILMHFRRGNTGYDVLSSIDEVIPVFGLVRQYETGILSFEDDAVPKGVITLTPVQ